MEKSVYVPPKEIPWTPEEVAFVASRSPREQALIACAKKVLGSSFFLRWTHMVRDAAAKPK